MGAGDEHSMTFGGAHHLARARHLVRTELAEVLDRTREADPQATAPALIAALLRHIARQSPRRRRQLERDLLALALSEAVRLIEDEDEARQLARAAE